MNIIRCIVWITISVISLSLSAQNKAFEVKVSGKGEPLLFFPGFTCPGEVWDDLVLELAKTNECHVFTFAGFGNVSPIEKPWLPKIKEEISQYITKKTLQKATIVGHSLGGALGLWLASESTFDFNKIIVVDALASTGALMMPDFNSEAIVYDNPFNQTLLDMDAKSFELMADQMVLGMALNKEKHELLKSWILNTDRETYVYGYTDLLKLDLRKVLAQIKVPVTILAATQPYGKENVKKTYEDQYKNLDKYSIKFADESAHFIMFDQPEWLLANIIEELK